MFRKRYALAPHRRKRLELRRNADWSDAAILLDGRELAHTSKEQLHEGLEIALPDQSLLRVWLETGPRGVPFLYLTRNGHPLPGSEGDPVKILWLTVMVFWSLAALQIFFAAAVLVYGNPDNTIYAIGAAGLALALLGILAWLRSYAATVLASLIVFAELFVLFYSAGNRNSPWEIWRPIMGLGILGWMLMRGINAVREINDHTLPVRHPPEPIRHQ